MNINLDVPTGKYRKFTRDEILELNKLLEKSSKTFNWSSSHFYEIRIIKIPQKLSICLNPPVIAIVIIKIIKVITLKLFMNRIIRFGVFENEKYNFLT